MVDVQDIGSRKIDHWKLWLHNNYDDEDQNEGYSDRNRIPRVLLNDGGSTYLLEKLLPSMENHKELFNRKLWSSSLLMSKEGRTLVKRSHLDFLKAGSDFASTVTYQCNFNACSAVSDELIENMLADGVRLARETVDEIYINEKRVAYVVATIGCYGAFLADGSEYHGKLKKAVMP